MSEITVDLDKVILKLLASTCFAILIIGMDKKDTNNIFNANIFNLLCREMFIQYHLGILFLFRDEVVC